VSQNGDIATAGGGAVSPSKNPIVNHRTVNKVVDDYIQAEFRGLKYNLFVPKNYDPSQKYPLVQFIVDAWGVGDDQTATLLQGHGGVIWARPEEQKKRECFVLSPQFPWPRIVDDDFSANKYVELDKSLIDYLTTVYSIDRNRIYLTGQSMGFLASCELNVRYPDYFAATLCVGGFWNPESMVVLKDKNIWFFVSEGDDRAFVTMVPAVDNLEAAGALVGRYHWNAKISTEELNAAIRAVSNDGNNIKFTLFDKDSTVPDFIPAKSVGTNHRGTWYLMYGIEAIREWLFNQALKR